LIILVFIIMIKKLIYFRGKSWIMNWN
jgi:hypothetical protein